jgi:hypothetical protein
VQTEILNAGVDVLIATPGRLLNHHERRSLNLSNTAALVMDEVDVLAGEGTAAGQESGQHPVACCGALPAPSGSSVRHRAGFADGQDW